MPGGSLSSWNADFATSWMPMPRSVPAMVKRPSLNSMSAFGRLQQMRRELLALGDDLLADQDDGAAAHGGGARAAGAHAERDRVGVALDELDPLRIDAEPVHQDLRLDGGVALAVRDRAGDEGHAAERIEADFGGLDGRVGGLLDGVGDADAAQHAALRGFLAPRLEAVQSASFMARSMFSSKRPLS